MNIKYEKSGAILTIFFLLATIISQPAKTASDESLTKNTIRFESNIDQVKEEMKPLNEIAFDLRKEKNDFEAKADELGLDSGEKNKYVKQIQSALDAIEKQTDYLSQVGRVIKQNF